MSFDINSACVIIPARYKSSRFPGKPLALIKGKEMILWVAELSALAVKIENVFVATDDERIARVVEKAGFKYILTCSSAQTGTDRLAEASKELNYDIVINVQGDEPLVNPDDVINCIKLKKANPEFIINGFAEFNGYKNALDINIPKVITNENNEMVYMSRSPLPATKNVSKQPNSYKRQVCISAFTIEELQLFKNFGRKSYLESYEDIELLRFLELNKKILMYECSTSSIAVDIPSDIDKVENYLDKKLCQ